MRNYKEAIIVMLDVGYSYNEIVQTLGCTKSTISFHIVIAKLKRIVEEIKSCVSRRV